MIRILVSSANQIPDGKHLRFSHAGAGKNWQILNNEPIHLGITQKNPEH
jgi:hypothetical protein